MGPKPQKGPSARNKPSEEEKEDVLQAVILADTFETRFSPFTLEKPRCLLPLCNTPLIEYTFEYLAHAGVQEVFIYGGLHTEQLESYVAASKWKSSTSPFEKLVFLRSTATSVGDVMRDLDQKHFITGDFIAVTGDVVCNFTIEAALKAHRARRQKDKNAIMTMLLRETTDRERTRAEPISPTFVINPTKSQCLHYEEAGYGKTSHVSIDPEMLSHPELEIRQDLIDCRIDICTPDVLSLWSDNFDNQSPRKDFLYGVLKDHELNGKTIHTYIINDHYAARVGSLLSYDQISRDIMARKAFPIAPGNNLFANQNFVTTKTSVYQEDGVVIARPCHVEAKTMIGRGTTIGAGSHVSNSIIGRRCHIGKNVNISDAYIWDDAIVGNDVKILKAIIANEASVGDRCTIGEGALISFGTKLESGSTVRSRARLTKDATSQGPRALPDETRPHTSESINDLQDDEDEDGATYGPDLIYGTSHVNVSSASLSSEASDSEAPSSYGGSRSASFATTTSDEDGTDRFHYEAVSSLFERMQNNADESNVRVELVSLRLANNASEHQVRKAVAVAITKHIQNVVDAGGATASDASKKTLEQYRNLVQPEKAGVSVPDQVDFLLEAQKDLTHRRDGAKILLHVAKDLYDLDIFEEEVFMEWWADERSHGDVDMRRVCEASAAFIDWLEKEESAASTEEESEGEE